MESYYGAHPPLLTNKNYFWKNFLPFLITTPL